MTTTFYKFKTAITLFWWGFKNPSVINASMFKMLSDILLLIMQVANEKIPRMTHIAHVHPELGEQAIVSIWAGAGMGADPLKRIKELLEENQSLKLKMRDMVNNESEHERIKKNLSHPQKQ